MLNFGARLLSGSAPRQDGYSLPSGEFGGGIELSSDPRGQVSTTSDAGTGQNAPPPAPQSASASGQSQSNHPGLAESLIPVWGSGREAVADWQDHNYVGAGLNGLLAASDLFLAGDVAKAVAKGGFYAIRGPLFRKASEQAWRHVRETMGPEGVGMLEAGQHGHHWFAPQKSWGKNVPDMFKNHPINIKAMPDTATHMRITGRYKGQPRFNQFDRWRYGTPTWSKVATVDALGHPIAATTADHQQ